MDKEKAKKLVKDCFESRQYIDPYDGMIAILQDDQDKLKNYKAILQESKRRSEMYCLEIDAAVDEKEIDKILSGVTTA